MKRKNFIGRSILYKQERSKGFLPEELKPFKNSISWPIALDIPNIHIASYFGENDYGIRNKSVIHEGIDIQIPAWTPILSPEKAELIYLDSLDFEGFYNLYLWGEKSKIAYEIFHLASVPEEFWRRANTQPDHRVIVDEGEYLGRIGKWPVRLEKRFWIPDDVEPIYGKNYDHLHFGVSYRPNGFNWNHRYWLETFNPLLILKKL